MKNSIFHKRCIKERNLKDIFLAESRNTEMEKRMVCMCLNYAQVSGFAGGKRRIRLELKHQRKLPDVLECVYQS